MEDRRKPNICSLLDLFEQSSLSKISRKFNNFRPLNFLSLQVTDNG